MQTPVYTWCVFPESALSIRNASFSSIGLPRISPFSATTVSAPNTALPWAWGSKATSSAFWHASAVTSAEGVVQPFAFSSPLAGIISKGCFIISPNSSLRRGDALASIQSIMKTQKKSRRPLPYFGTSGGFSLYKISRFLWNARLNSTPADSASRISSAASPASSVFIITESPSTSQLTPVTTPH